MKKTKNSRTTRKAGSIFIEYDPQRAGRLTGAVSAFSDPSTLRSDSDVWPPDVGFELSQALSPSEETELVNAIKATFPGARDVRAFGGNTEKVGIWFTSSSVIDVERDRGVQQLRLLGPGEKLGCFINSTFIRRTGAEQFALEPKRRSAQGAPAADGENLLTGMDIEFQPPDRILTKIRGINERAWPNMAFDITITDTLFTSGGRLACSSGRELNVDQAELNALLAAFSFLFPPLAVVYAVEKLIIAFKNPPQTIAGIGARTIQLVPPAVMIPRGMKVELFFERVNVDSGGIFAGGHFFILPRVPAAAITGDEELVIFHTARDVESRYDALTSEMRQPLKYRWKSSGRVSAPTTSPTNVRFSRGPAAGGTQLDETIDLRVTDTDGLVAIASLAIKIYVLGEDEDNDLDFVCTKKPYLPQCNPSRFRSTERKK